MLDARKSTILRKVVAEHIETGQPVGSAHLVRDAAIDVSPATVRADMAALERDGYLTHPHTSAGRIPTDKGYRFFVDQLSPTGPLDARREEQVQAFFARAHHELEQMLRDTSRLLSTLTDSAAVVVAPSHEVLTVRSALLTRLGERAALLLVVLSNGAVEKHMLELAAGLADDEVDLANNCLREALTGQRFGSLRPSGGCGQQAVDELVAGCFTLLTEAAPAAQGAEVYVGGTARMAEQFGAVDTVREVLAILEQSFVVVSLLSEAVSHGQSVSIGTENGMESLAECSLVVAPYEVGDEVVGTIGVLGPTRMNYSQALAAVAVVGERLSRQLTSG
ncbi:MAG TPA: heat-inducible transcriptional repressor HrcA [Acidimicrobiales bacterium]|nr:heat-inducible transcriptional repressor HrcA [Acidimicrobiales bacterium]